METGLLEAWHLALNRFHLELESCRDWIRQTSASGEVDGDALDRALGALRDAAKELDELLSRLLTTAKSDLDRYETEYRRRLEQFQSESERLVAALRELAQPDLGRAAGPPPPSGHS